METRSSRTHTPRHRLAPSLVVMPFVCKGLMGSCSQESLVELIGQRGG